MPETIFGQSWESMEMESIGPGDPDVNTKDGRITTVKINLTRPEAEPQATRLKVHVIYDVIEGRRDFTHLQMNRDILLGLPFDWRNVVVKNAADFNFEMVVSGKNHQWIPIDVSECNWIQSIEAKIDGPGDDNSGNAGLRIVFAIPLEFEQG